jgi:lipopolysaccharide transport system ATP-binding protein
LAFAVAAHLEPEILLVDEVLAVGDAAFQKKCLGKMSGVAQSGRTVLFVSHNMGAITRLCKRSLWLDKGQIVVDGASQSVVAQYQTQHFVTQAEWHRPDTMPKEDTAFLYIAAENNNHKPIGIFMGDEPITIHIHYVVNRPLSGCAIGIRVNNTEGFTVFTTAEADQANVSAQSKTPGSYHSRFTIPGNFLAPGTYTLHAAAHLPSRSFYDQVENPIVFEVSSSMSLTSLDGRLGVVAPLIRWETSSNTP